MYKMNLLTQGKGENYEGKCFKFSPIIWNMEITYVSI